MLGGRLGGQTMVDVGKYHENAAEYQRLVDAIYRDNPPMTVPPEIAHFITHDSLRLLIRLARYKFVARMVRSTDSILEVGSGNGLGALFLAQHAAQVLGIETKQTEVSEARSICRRDNVRFEETDLFDLKADAAFDIAVALDVIEHMPVEQGRALVRAMAQHIRPDGLVIIGTPSRYSLPYQSAVSRASHVNCYEQAELKGLLEEQFARVLPFSMNDELVHTGAPTMAWYYFMLGFGRKIA